MINAIIILGTILIVLVVEDLIGALFATIYKYDVYCAIGYMVAINTFIISIMILCAIFCRG